MNKKRECGKKITPCNSYPQTGMASPNLELAGRVELNKLTSTVLSKLLRLKKVPNRSKFKKKAEKLYALEGLITLADIEQHNAMNSKNARIIQVKNENKALVKPGEGIRLEENVGGVDVHKKVLAAAVAGPNGILAEHEFLNVHESIEDLIKLLLYHEVKHVGMESTAEYWQKLAWKLSEAGFEVLVANPQQTKSTQGKKTDKLDAKRIAIALRDGRLKPSVVCAPDQYVRRKLSRDAIKKAQQGANAINRLKVMFTMFDAAEWIEELYKSQRGKRIFYRCLELSDMDSIEAILTEEYGTRRGSITDSKQLVTRAKELHAFLTRMDVDEGNRIRFTQHLNDYVSCREMSDKLYLEILKHATKDRQFKQNLQLLVTLPGIDVRSAISILVEIADVNYFERAKSLAKWIGLAPSVNQSGYKKRHSGRIYKGGNKWLRKVLWLAASLDYAHVKEDEESHPVGAFIRRLMKSEKKQYRVAVTAGARKLATFIFHVLTQQRPFEEMFELQHSEWLEKNRKRKLSTLKKKIRQSTVVEILPILVAELSEKTIELNRAETNLARELSNLLGIRAISCMDPPWS